MTNEKLRQANELQERVRNQEKVFLDTKKTFKAISLKDDEYWNGFNVGKIAFSVNERHCYVDKERLLEFLKKEVEISEKELYDLTKQFEAL